MREEITAEWAHKQATNVLNEKVLNQINKILTNIEESVKVNKFSTTIYSDLHELTIKEIQSRGFKLDKNGDYNQQDGQSYTITW